MDHEWVAAPVGIDAHRWISRARCRTLLAVVHSMVSCHRLLDVVDLVETDPRVQVVFTVGPDVFNGGVESHLRELGALVIPWHQAVRSNVDLILAASHGGLQELHSPVLLMAHGAGHGKLVPRAAHGGPPTRRGVVYGLDPQRLVRDGRVLASTIVLAHHGERDVLSEQCPDALPAALLAGDICLDRLEASVHRRDDYRRALGVGAGQKLVVVSSTWGSDGLYGRFPGLLTDLLEQLSADRFRVAALLHPAVWAAHGQRQIRAWTRAGRAAGLILLRPADDWRALIAAADYAVGDHGSVTAYAAAVGIPILRIAPPAAGVTTPGSAQDFVMRYAGQLQPQRPLEPQLLKAKRLDAVVGGLLSSHPGAATQLLRRAVYKRLGLPMPNRRRVAEAVPAPGTRRS